MPSTRRVTNGSSNFFIPSLFFLLTLALCSSALCSLALCSLAYLHFKSHCLILQPAKNLDRTMLRLFLFLSHSSRLQNKFLGTFCRHQNKHILEVVSLPHLHRYQKSQNRLLKVCYVPATSAGLSRLLFLWWPLTVLMK